MRDRWRDVCLVSLILAASASWAEDAPRPAKPAISLTLIPPSPVTDRIALEVRGAVWNRQQEPQKFDVAFYLDAEKPEALLHRAALDVAPGAALGVSFRWPTAGRAGKHRVLVVARSGAETRRMERPIEVLASDARSTRRLGGAWVDIYHHNENEAVYFNQDLGKMTGPQWRELVRSMHDIQMDVLIITMMFQNFTHRGQHAIERDGYQGKAYYPSKLFAGRMPIACQDPLEEILSEADKLGMHVLPGLGCYAFFDYTPGALQWHKRVAAELWQLYGHHPSFYGWYISGEKDGGLGSAEERKEIVDFFREFTPFVRRMAPDKPVLLAPNCYHLRGAEETYRQLLPHLDILSPFAFHRMPANDLPGEEAARLLQSLCDSAGCHLWMDLETFVFHKNWALYPRPISGLASDVRRFPNFEKIVCYQFPGLMSGPTMSRQPGGPPSVKLYRDYQRFLETGTVDQEVRHEALRRPVSLAHRYDARYTGGGDGALTDGRCGECDYRDPVWQGYWQADLAATIDLGRPVPLGQVSLGCLQQAEAGIYLPREVEYAVSSDGKEFRTAATVKHDVPGWDRGPLLHPFSAALGGVEARYLRVRARNVGQIPEGHPARGEKAWLFADEILVNVK
jgi:hypothetical protein